MLILDGKQVAAKRFETLKNKISDFKSTHSITPGLTVVLVGEDPASQVYVKNKTKTSKELGMNSEQISLPVSISQVELESRIEELNRNDKVHAILVQLPLPKHLNEERALDKISAYKDVDGLNIENQGLLWAGRPRTIPCTPHGVMKILEHYKIEIVGRKAVVIGRSQIVGKPMAALLLAANASVSICHSKTKDLKDYTLGADIVVVAAGIERFIGKDSFAQGSVVVDVGMHRPQKGPFANKLCGDVRYEELGDWVSAATPVPGGVGPMTIQMLMENTLLLAELKAR